MERIVPGLLIAGLWLLLLLKGSVLLFNLIVAIAVLIAADEYVKMADPRPVRLAERLALGVTVSFPLLFTCIVPDRSFLLAAIIAAFAALTCYFLYRYKDIEQSYDLFCRFIFGVFYIGALGAHLVLLRSADSGAEWLIICSAITACSDSGAYFVGKATGKRKLCPNISPNKTIEGAIGGIVSGCIAGLIFAVMLLPQVNLLFVAVSGIFLSIVGIAGDLTESIIKRGTGTKDSGRCLGGHGGILDRVDSLLFAAPVLYYLLIYSVA